MNITVKKLAELHKPAHNIRRHSDKQITEYIRSIEMFGQVKPLVVAEDGEIIAGNGLYEALLRMGRETCDCYVMVGLTDVQKKKLMMADNKVYELGFTDVDQQHSEGQRRRDLHQFRISGQRDSASGVRYQGGPQWPCRYPC